MPLFSALTRKMSWLTQRQAVLAQNVSHVDTPGYRAVELRPLDFRRELAAFARKDGGAAPADSAPTLTPAMTNPGHMAGIVEASAVKPVADKTTPDRAINGNTVSLEDEMEKVAQNSSDYQLMTNLYKKQVAMLMSVIGAGNTGG